MKWPTPEQINIKIAQILGMKICEHEPPRAIINGDTCYRCEGRIPDHMKWATDRNEAAKLPSPVSEWNQFGEIVQAIYLNYIDFSEDRKMSIPPSIITEILFMEPWLMPLAWVVNKGWEWNGKEWREVIK